MLIKFACLIDCRGAKILFFSFDRAFFFEPIL